MQCTFLFIIILIIHLQFATARVEVVYTMMEIRPLEHELQEKAIVELNEDPRRIQEAFDHIREWLRKQPHLNVRKDDQTMIAFFRGCKWNVQIVKQKLDYFYSFRSLTPEFFVGVDPLTPEIQKVLQAGFIFPLPMATNYFGPVIVMYNLKNVDGNETPLAEITKVFFMTLDILIREDDDCVVTGLTLLFDQDQCPASYLLHFTPTVMKNYVKGIQNAYPLRTKSVVFLNTLTVFETICNTLIKPFLNAKMRQRFQVLNAQSSKKFLSEFPKQLLPKEYGGTNGSVKDAAEKWKDKIESYREWFIEGEKYVTNEKLRIDKTMMLENDFGVDGTFRNLLID